MPRARLRRGLCRALAGRSARSAPARPACTARRAARPRCVGARGRHGAPMPTEKRYAQDAVVALVEVAPATARRRVRALHARRPARAAAVRRHAMRSSGAPRPERARAARGDAPSATSSPQLQKRAGPQAGPADRRRARARCSRSRCACAPARIGARAVSSATRRRRCIRWRARDSISGCAMRGTWRRSCGMRRIPGDAATLARYRARRRLDARRDDPRHRPARRGFSRRQSARRAPRAALALTRARHFSAGRGASSRAA